MTIKEILQNDQICGAMPLIGTRPVGPGHMRGLAVFKERASTTHSILLRLRAPRAERRLHKACTTPAHPLHRRLQ